MRESGLADRARCFVTVGRGSDFPGLLAWGIGAALVGSLACSDTPARPAGVLDCNDADCRARRGSPSVSVGSLQSVTGGQGGGAGSGGTAGQGPSSVTLSGDVRMIVEPDLLGADTPNALVEIRAAGASGDDVVVNPEADGSFILAGVVPQVSAWVAVGAFDDPPSEPFMDTLQRVDSAAGQPVRLVVVRRAVMDAISQLSFFNTPLELDPERGHTIIQFVDANAVPVPQLSLTFPNSADVGIAYDAGDIYSDALEETSVRGTVVVLNMPAAPYPGVVANVVAELPSSPPQRFSSTFRIAAGSVTVLTVELDLDP